MGRNSNQDGTQLPFALCPHAYNIRLNNLVGESDEASLCPREAVETVQLMILNEMMVPLFHAPCTSLKDNL